MREAAAAKERLKTRSLSLCFYGGVTSVVLAILLVQGVILFNEKAPDTGAVAIIILVAAAWWGSEIRRVQHRGAGMNIRSRGMGS